MIGEEAERQALEAQMQAATEIITEEVRRMLHEDEIHPELIVRVVDRVAGELTAAATLAGGQDESCCRAR